MFHCLKESELTSLGIVMFRGKYHKCNLMPAHSRSIYQGKVVAFLPLSKSRKFLCKDFCVSNSMRMVTYSLIISKQWCLL